MMPKILRNFNLVIAHDLSKQVIDAVDEITLPKLTIKTQEYRFGGMDIPVKIDVGMDPLEADFSITGYNEILAKILGKYALFTFTGAVRDKENKDIQMKIVVKGLASENDFGNWKSGEGGTTKVKIECNYYRLEFNNKTSIEIDPDNFVRIIDGVDHLESARNALDL